MLIVKGKKIFSRCHIAPADPAHRDLRPVHLLRPVLLLPQDQGIMVGEGVRLLLFPGLPRLLLQQQLQELQEQRRGREDALRSGVRIRLRRAGGHLSASEIFSFPFVWENVVAAKCTL